MSYRAMLMLAFIIPASCFASDYEDLTKFFNRSETDHRISQIDGALDSFRKITGIISSNSNLKKDYGLTFILPHRIPDDAQITVQFKGETFGEVGNMDWETQNLGFVNWMKYVEGYIDFLELENAKLKLEQSRFKNAMPEKIKILQQDIEKRSNYLRDRYIGADKWAD